MTDKERGRDVHWSISTVNKKRFALKASCDRGCNIAEKEIDIMQKIDHPHIVKLFGYFLHSSNFYKNVQCILIEFCDVNYFFLMNCELKKFNLIFKHKKKLVWRSASFHK